MTTLSVLFVLWAILLPCFDIDAQLATPAGAMNRSLDPRFLNWLNSLFYLPPEGEIRIRKEYRVLSDQERNNFHNAIRLLKQDTSVPPNKFDALASLHHLNTAMSAHGGPNFLGWHRTYLVLCENAMREKVANVTIPYWDNTLEEALPVPRQSILFSPLFMGTANGQVTEGPFAFWSTPFGPLGRDVGSDRRLMNPNDISAIMSQSIIADITNPNAPEATNMEELHNDVHVYVGHIMSRIESASYDPLFYCHHAFIDYLWEEFRTNQRMRGIDPSRDYPRIVGEQAHQPLASMGLGRLLVIDGINDIFTRRIYRYERRPACVPNSNTCGSQYLRCDWSRQRCVPLIMNQNGPNMPQAMGQTGPPVQVLPWWARQGSNANTNQNQFVFG
ncbi:putative tyrosinase-like protein tyr-1 [Dreissena polymorpha]|nr:putative tyrosinase-like protein tyr-1 [Dreissena polymorpha]